MSNKMTCPNKLFIPQHYFPCVLQIPFGLFQKQGIKALIFDLDNTLIECNKDILDEQIKTFLTKLSIIFKVVILSNASKKRLHKVLKNDFAFIYLNLLNKKPSPTAFKKACQLLNLEPTQMLMIGDQLQTDIKGANQAGFCSLLVKPLNRLQESAFTKFNRFYREKKFLTNLKKQDYHFWKEKFQDFEEK
ncbi:YqeG family HAD IIIA-type phosphatase [Candidatus Phytoplasma tritici]|uniref:YqeG family HAD IIIA-type phosphatase n=1 Tax=Candidatus Phytoplasma tritici TaxID=321961 RepID=UPI00046576AA|nr:YqeG family HAD IIIA-type phosphatase [Candidatus Phytoplasma tritici]